MTNIMTTGDGFEQAARILREGGLLGVPTETVYGLAADACNATAVAKIYAAKGRPDFNPLIVHVDSLKMAEELAVFDPLSRRLAEEFWPGPLTLVLPLRGDAALAPSVTAGLGTVALRQPIGVLAELASSLGTGIAAPSANSSGRISPTTAQHVADDLEDRVDLVLDGGTCAVGVESTIVKCTNGKINILRTGGITADQLTEIAPLAEPEKSGKIEAPGQLLAHYAPDVPLRMNAHEVDEGEGQLAFGPAPLHSAGPSLNLSPTGDVAEAARNLFAMMKTLDSAGVAGIAVQPVPENGIGAAINDRLRRAAHGSQSSSNQSGEDHG